MQDEPRQAFTQLLDRGLASEAAIACWCPTMDLLALVTADGQLQVHRLNWQRLWSTAPESPVTALAWRPDGKQLAVGHADGALAVLSPEDGETLHTSPYQSGAIAALSWTQCAQEEDAPLPHGLRSGLEDRAPRLFEPPLPAGAAAPAGAPAGYAHRLGRRDTLAWPPRPARLDALVAVAADGEVTAYADGLHPMLASGPPAAEAHPVVRVLAVGQPPSLREIVVLVEDSRGALALRGLGSAALGARAGALRAAAALAADVLAGAGRLAAAAAAAVGEWEAGLAAQAELTGTLEALLADHGIDSDATADLLLLVTMGEYSAAMEQFLSTALGEAGLKRAARVVDAALCAVHAAVVDRVAPEAELAAFRLGELRGLAMAPQWRDHLHLKVSMVGSAERMAHEVMRLAERLRVAAAAAAGQYRVFFAWLTTALRRFPEDTVDTLMGYPLTHIDSVQEFLHSEFKRSPVGPLLDSQRWGGGAAPTPPPREVRAAPGTDARRVCEAEGAADAEDDLAAVMAVLERSLAAAEAPPAEGARGAAAARGLGDWAGRGLTQVVQDLAAHCQAALHSPAARRGEEQLTLAWAASLGRASRRSARSMACVDVGAVDLILGEDRTAGAPHTVDIVRVSAPRGGGEQAAAAAAAVEAGPPPRAVRACRLGVPGGGAVLDAAPYKHGGHMVLLEAPGGECTLAHLPEAALRFAPLPSAPLEQSAAPAEVVDPLAAPAGSARRLAAPGARRPLAVSASRGVGFVQGGARRALLFDLEEDEPEEEEDGGEEGQQMAAGAEGEMATP